MTPERWRQVKEVFEAAQESPPDERVRFVAEACAGDEEMRREVASLLSSFDSADSFMERPAVGEVADAIAGATAKLTGGQRLNHYEIVAPLGAGGMGEVFLATDTKLKRKVALKLLPPDFTGDKARLRRFEQEAQTASALNHPNIITIYEVGAEANLNFIATEFVDGQTLRQKMRGAGLPLNETLEIAQQIAGALVAAHQAGIVHRDIKPENIMVRPDGLVKVLDFGIAKLFAPASATVDREAETIARGLTRPGIILGTLHYMSPEQVRGLPLDARSDIFSVGAVLYEMLTGAGPFVKPTKSDVIAAILTETPPPLTNLRTDAPPELQRIVAKALQKNRENRYQTSRDLLLDLKSLGQEMELAGNPARMTQPTNVAEAYPTSPLSTRRFSLTQTLALLLLAGLAISAAWWFAFRGNAPVYAPSSLKTAEVATWRSTPGEGYSIGSFSPDGMKVAFVTTAGGNGNIYVKQTAANALPVQTTKDEFHNNYPIWSPDGEEIAYFSLRGNQPGLWRTPYLGGSPRLIKTVEESDTIPRYWSKSGALYYEAKENLFALDMQSGQTAQLTNLDATQTDAFSFSISPDEKQIAYISYEGEQWSIRITAVRGDTPKQIFRSAADIKTVNWHSDSRRLFYSALVDDALQIFVTDIDGHSPTQITFGDRDSLALDVSTDGAKILYGSTKEESDIWGVNVTTTEEFALTSDISTEFWPNISSDSKTVAFQSTKNDRLLRGAIMVNQAVSTAPPAQLVANGFLPVWSPDGNQLAFMRVVGEAYNLWAIKATGGAEKQLTQNGLLTVTNTLLPYNRTEASIFSWSPNSAKIAFIAQRGEVCNMWLAAADGGGETQLTDNSDAALAFYSPLWSSDGKHIAYTSKSYTTVDGKPNYSVWVIDVETRKAKLVFQAENFLRLLGWAEDEKGLIIATRKSKAVQAVTEVGLVEIRLDAGAPRPITVQPSTYLYNIHLSADRRTLAFVSQQDGKDNLWLMPASGGAAKKLTANNDTRLYFSSLAWSPDGKAIFFGKQARYGLLSMFTNFK